LVKIKYMEEHKSNLLGSLFETAGDYAETRINLFKLKAVDKSSEVVASFAAFIIIAIVVTSGTFILTVGLCLWLGSILGHIWYGFFIVGCFYMLIAVLLFVFKNRWLKGPVNDVIVKKIFN
jgi:hypothetical protein